MSLNKYLNPSFTGPYAQSTINGIQDSWDQANTLRDYIANISLDNATDADLNNLGLIIGYPRPVLPAGGYLDSPTYIVLLKQISVMKFNGVNFESLDKMVYYTIFTLGGNPNYYYSYSSNGVSSPDADIIINIIGAIDSKWVYILQTVLNIFLTQGIRVTIINNPFVFAKWNGSNWDTNPLGSGFSRLTGSTLAFNNGNNILLNNGNILAVTDDTTADKTHGGQMYGVI